MTAQSITSTTQAHLNIEDIQNHLLLLKNGAAAMVLQTSAVNFGLLSEQEQDAIIYAYAALLNSLTFPIQILIRSKKKDISHYLDLLKQQQEKQADSTHRQQIQVYRQFIESLVKEGNILDKRFYIVIPFSTLELGIGKATTGALGALKPGKKTTGLPFPKDYILQRALTALEPKRDHLTRQFARLGLRVHQLTTQELIELFFDLYNPDSAGTKLTDAKDYTQPLVQPAVSPVPPTGTGAAVTPTAKAVPTQPQPPIQSATPATPIMQTVPVNSPPPPTPNLP